MHTERNSCTIHILYIIVLCVCESKCFSHLTAQFIYVEARAIQHSMFCDNGDSFSLSYTGNLSWQKQFQDGTNISVVAGGIGGVMGVIILTMIAVIVVILLRQSAKGKANKRYKNII